MDPSQDGNRERQNKAPTAAQLQAFANRQSIVAGQKRDADKVSDLEIPEGSRPMLGLDKTRHRPNHPKYNSPQQSSSDPGISSSLSTINAIKSSVSHQKVEPSSAPPPSSSPAIALESPSDIMDSTVSEPSPAVSNLQSLDPEPSRSPITSTSGFDPRSPAIRSMLRDAFNEGRVEGLEENEAKLDEAEAKIEELRKRLDPAKLKAAYERGWRDGGIEGFNKYSVNPETKPKDDRLAFDKICKEKDKAIHDQQQTMAKYQKELMARKSRIETLERQVNLGTPQPPTQQQGPNITGQQISDAEARFSAQRQELDATKARNQGMRTDLANWQVQWGLVIADLEKWKAAFNTKAGQLDACQRQLSQSNGELQESKAQANKLAATNSVDTGSLKAATKELKSKLNQMSFDFNSLDGRYTTLVQVAAERSAEMESVKAELKITSKQVQDGKDVTNALTSKNIELTKLRKQLEEKVGRQAKQIEGLSDENEELYQKLGKREVEDDTRAPRNSESSPSQAIGKKTREIDALPTNMAQETAAANIELVREVVERERRTIEADNLMRENRVTATLKEMGETERRRRQLLMDELEDKDAQLYEAQKKIRELAASLLAASPTQPSPIPPSAPTPSSSSLSPLPPPPHMDSSSPSEKSPSSIEIPPPTIPTSSAAPSQSSSRLSRIPILHVQTNFSPRRLLIILAIFLLAFLVPSLRFFGRPISEDTHSQQEAINFSPEAEVGSRGKSYDDRRRQWGARAMGIWERNERIANGEVLGWEEEEYRPLAGWDY